MTCSPHAIPYRTWRLRIFSDLFLPRNDTQLSQRGRRCFSSARKLQNEPSSVKPPNQNAPKSRPSDSLPRSPLFEISKTHQSGARSRKPRRTKADDARLANNPWAMALASPIRECVVTKARVPKAFLTEMGLIRRVGGPEPPRVESNNKERVKRDLWWMPIELLRDELKAIAASSSKHDDTTASQMETPPYKKPAVARLLSRSLAFEYIPRAMDNPVEKLRPFRMVPTKWKDGTIKLGATDMKGLIWRRDMLPFVTKYMRRDVVKKLKEAYRYERAKKKGSVDQWRGLQLSNLSVSEMIEGLRGIDGMADMGTGAVVILGGDEVPNSDGSPFKSGFPDYLTLPQTKSAVPVYDLRQLLTTSERDELRQSIPRFGETEAFFFRPDGPKSVEAMLGLWELKGFVMHDVEFFQSSAPDAVPDSEEHGST